MGQGAGGGPRRSGRGGRRSSGQRGVIAILSAAVVGFVVILTLAVAQLGLFVVRRAEVRGAAEATAALQAERLKVIPAPNNNAYNTPVMVQGNAGPQDQSQVSTTNRVSSDLTGLALVTDYRLAPTVTAVVSGPTRMLTPLLPGMPQTVSAQAQAAVQQFEWRDFVPVRSRTVLVLDFSNSMGKSWTTDGHTTTMPGYQVVAQAATLILDGTNPNIRPNMVDRNNFGLVIFSDEPSPAAMTNVVNLVDGPNSPTADLPQAQLSAQLAALKDKVGTTRPSGSASNTADALQRAVDMLNNHTDRATAAAGAPADQWLGRGTIVLISDGLPNFDPAHPTDQNLATADARQLVAQANACRVINGQGMISAPGSGNNICGQGQRSGSAWDNGGPVNRSYQTFTLTIQTDLRGTGADINSAFAAQAPINDFMASMAGNANKDGRPNPSFALLPDNPDVIAQTLGTINPATHCIGKRALGVELRNSNWMRAPVANSASNPAQRLQEDVWGYHAHAATWTTWETSVIRAASAYDATFDGPLPTGTGDWSSNVQDVRYAYTPNPGQFDDGLVELNAVFCLQFLRDTGGPARGNGSTPTNGPHFRLRWGPPMMNVTTMR